MKTGDTVEWTSQANGNMKTKRGMIVAVIRKCKDFRIDDYRDEYKLMFDGGWPRKHESYLVAVPTKSSRGRARLYFPRVGTLRLVEPAAAIKCSAPPSLPPAANAAELRELGHTAETEIQPTPLELRIEFEMGRMSVDEYKAECERYGYPL